jgi:hypothetical protein
VIDLDAAFGQQLLDVAVRQREAQVQRTASTITSGGKQNPANAEREMGEGRGRVLMATARLLEARSQQLQQSRRSYERAGYADDRTFCALSGLYHLPRVAHTAYSVMFAASRGRLARSLS